MKADVIRQLLDSCLLTEEEMQLGPRQWKRTMKRFDSYNFVLEDSILSDSDDSSSESEDEDDDEEDRVERMGESEVMKGKKRMMGSQGGRPCKM